MNQISMDNGRTFKAVEALTDAEIKAVMADIDASANVEEVADALNRASGRGDTDREWLKAFLAELGQNWIIG